MRLVLLLLLSMTGCVVYRAPVPLTPGITCEGDYVWVRADCPPGPHLRYILRGREWVKLGP